MKKKTKKTGKTKPQAEKSAPKARKTKFISAQPQTRLVPRLLRAHRARIGKHWTWPEHINQENEWCFVKKGQLCTKLEDIELTANQGDFYFVLPGQWHHEIVLSDSLEQITIRFDLLDENSKPCWFLNPDRLENQIIRNLDQDLVDLFEKILQLGWQEKPGSDEIIETIILQMIWSVRQKLNQNLPKPNPEKISRRRNWLVEQAMEYIKQNLHSNFTISQLAHSCCASRYHLSHVFKETIGMPPLQYAQRLRIDQARDLLSDDTIRISEISRKIGFKDPFYFSRQFKKLTGHSPQTYREKLHNPKSK